MRTVAFLLIVTALVAVKADEIATTKRGLAIWEFGKMIKCATGRSSLNYLFYGCWCGKGGYGKPVDETDRCCYNHDKCYQDLKNSGTCSWIYFKTYRRVGCIGCSSRNTGCGKELCKCDKIAAQCFANARYDRKYKYHFNEGRC